MGPNLNDIYSISSGWKFDAFKFETAIYNLIIILYSRLNGIVQDI